MGGELQIAREVATSFLSLAEQHEDTTAMMYGHRMLGWTALLLGQLAEVRPDIDKSLELYVPEKHSPLRFRYVHDGRVAAYCCLVCYQWLIGYPEQAIATGEAAIAYARQLETREQFGLCAVSSRAPGCDGRRCRRGRAMHEGIACIVP